MLYERIEKLCLENGTNITALCKEITGSTGNIPTWKKDKIWPSALVEICKKFKISSDALLDVPNWKKTQPTVPSDNDFLDMIQTLPPEKRWELRGYIKRMLEEESPIPSVAADDLPPEVAAK